MKRVIIIVLTFFVFTFFYRLFFCDFIVYTKTYGYEYRKHPIVWVYPRGIMSPFVKEKIEKKVLRFINSNKNYIVKKTEPDILDFENIQILSVISRESDKEEVLVYMGEYVVFYIDGNKITVD